MVLNLLVTNGFLCEKEMRKMKYKGIKHALWHKDFLKGDVDYEETYSPVMDAITLQYLIRFTVHEQLEMHLMDVVNLIMRYT